MSQAPSNQNNPNNATPPKQGFRFPAFAKPGALANRLVSASKALLGTNASSPITGLDTGSGMFGGYRPSNANFTNIPLARFQSVNEYLGAYGSVAAVFTCVSTIANSIAGLPTDFVDQTGKSIATLGQKEAEDDSLADLLENPNPYQDWYALRETIAAHLELCGNALVLMDDMDGLGRPAALYPLNPGAIKLAVSPETGLLGYIYQPGGATKIYYSVDEVLHFKMSNPSSIFWGQGTLQAIAGNLNTEIDILDSVNALYRNGAVIPGAFVSKEQMTDTEFTRLKSQLMQEHTGSANFFKPLLLDGGLDWKSMSIGHTDLGTTEIRTMNREEIYMAFGVPVSQAGNQGRANVKNDHLTDVFWVTTIGPKVHRIEAGFKKLTKRYDPRYSIKMPLPVKVAESEMLDNVVKVDTLTSLSNSEKRKAIKTITGDQFGWGDIPDEMPVEAADQAAMGIGTPGASPTDPNAPQLPPDGGGGGTDPNAPGQGQGQDTGPDLETMPLAQAVLDAGLGKSSVQSLVDAGILDESYLTLFDGTGTGKAWRHGGGRGSSSGLGGHSIKRPGSRGGHPWTDAHGVTRYGPQPTGNHRGGAGAGPHKKPGAAATHRTAAPTSQKRTSSGNSRAGHSTSVRTAQKKELVRINKMLQSGKDKWGHELPLSARTAMAKITQKLRDDIYSQKYAPKAFDDFEGEVFERDILEELDQEISITLQLTGDFAESESASESEDEYTGEDEISDLAPE